MSHIDEGALHAYLDGALDEYPVMQAQLVREHLEVCAACRERLEAERGIRDEAASVLGLAAPEVTVPSFEELRTYVRANAPRRSPVSVRIYRLGWAASVVLALGTGWMLRGGQVPVTSPTGLSSDQISPQEAPASFDAEERDAAALERSIEAAPVATGSRLTQGAQSAPDPAAEVARQEAAAVPPTVTASQPVAATPSEPSDQPALLDVVADLDVTTALPPGARSDEAVAPDATARRASAQSAALPTSVPDPLAAEPLAELLAERENEKVTDGAGAAGVAEPERRAEPSDLVTSANVGAPAVGLTGRARSIEFGDARDITEDEESYSLVVPNLELIEVLNRGSVRPEGQVVRQILESGDTLVIIHLPPEMDPAAVEDPSPGDNELVVQRAAGWIVMRAPVGDEALHQLLERLLEER